MITNDNACFPPDTAARPGAEHASALHTTLPMEDLIGLFAGEIRDQIVFDSFEFENCRQLLHYFIGIPKLHKCHYTLKAGDVEFGQITLTRIDPFRDSEINMIEGALAALAIHLVNAIAFQSGLSADSLLTLQAERLL